MAPVIKAEKLVKRYPGFAPVLRGADISVEPGEMTAIMGPSGCGKSTMLHILGLLHAPDEGSLEILGVDALKLDREGTAAFRRSNLGFVMQSSNLFEHSTVFENVEFPLIYENVPPQERWERVIRALDLVRLSARVHYPSNRLSGGEQQRVAIARAMVNNPRILLADEPTGALDARTSRLIMENFRNLCHSGGVSLVMVTHDPKMAEYCDTIYTLEDGLLVTRKKGNPPFTSKSGGNFLKAPDPAVFGALVADYFPETGNPELVELARRLHGQGMLSRVYALADHIFGDPTKGYALALPVRRMGIFKRFFSLSWIFGSLYKNFAKRLMAAAGPKIPLSKRMGPLCLGYSLSGWGKQDDIQFFYAASAGKEATGAWVAASLLNAPFAFNVSARDLAGFNAGWFAKAKDALFIACPSNSVMAEVKKLLKGQADSKLILMRPPPVAIPSEDEQEPLQQTGKPVEILCMGAEISPAGFTAAMSACGQLKITGMEMRISVLGESTWKQAGEARKAGLKKEVVFLGAPDPENLAESYKNADIFIAPAPAASGGELELPLYVCEAMTFGVGIAAYNMTRGMGEALKPGENCLAAIDVHSLVKILRKLADNREERAKLGATARQDIVALLDVDATSLKVADLIAAAVGASQAKKQNG